MAFSFTGRSACSQHLPALCIFFHHPSTPTTTPTPTYCIPTTTHYHPIQGPRKFTLRRRTGGSSTPQALCNQHNSRQHWLWRPIRTPLAAPWSMVLGGVADVKFLSLALTINIVNQTMAPFEGEFRLGCLMETDTWISLNRLAPQA